MSDLPGGSDWRKRDLETKQLRIIKIEIITLTKEEENQNL